MISCADRMQRKKISWNTAARRQTAHSQQKNEETTCDFSICEKVRARRPGAAVPPAGAALPLLVSQYCAIAAFAVWLILFFREVHFDVEKAFEKYRRK